MFYLLLQFVSFFLPGLDVNMAMKGLMTLNHLLELAACAQTEHDVMDAMVMKARHSENIAKHYLSKGLQQTVFSSWGTHYNLPPLAVCESSRRSSFIIWWSNLLWLRVESWWILISPFQVFVVKMRRTSRKAKKNRSEESDSGRCSLHDFLMISYAGKIRWWWWMDFQRSFPHDGLWRWVMNSLVTVFVTENQPIVVG